jgi:hypothetical protein
MEWNETPESSNIAGFGYDGASCVLTVEFKNGSKYDYYDVPNHVYESMKVATSKGQFLAHSIKGNFRYARQ